MCLLNNEPENFSQWPSIDVKIRKKYVESLEENFFNDSVNVEIDLEQLKDNFVEHLVNDIVEVLEETTDCKQETIDLAEKLSYSQLMSHLIKHLQNITSKPVKNTILRYKILEYGNFNGGWIYATSEVSAFSQFKKVYGATELDKSKYQLEKVTHTSADSL